MNRANHGLGNRTRNRHRLLLIALLGAGIVACATVRSNDPAIDLERLAWLVGTWQRTDLPSDDTGYERWQRAGSGYVGTSVHERASGRRFEEKLSLIVRDGAVHYIADTPQNPAPVAFRLTHIADRHVAFENPQHDYPKTIEYRRDGDHGLSVRISAGDKASEFHFSRVR